MKSRKLSNDEVKQISLRMKSARMLTGLNQEIFAAKHNISPTSLKTWETGRSVPRREGLMNFLNAIKKGGIEITYEWIFSGSGAGPTYIVGTQKPKPIFETKFLDRQIELFRNSLLAKGRNPIVTVVLNNNMIPFYKKGDLIGGYYFNIEEMKKTYPLDLASKIPWLVMESEENFFPSLLFFENSSENIFYRNTQNISITKYNNNVVGKISCCFDLDDLS